MTATGGCHCGAIRYAIEGDPVYSALCHCTDCTRAAGAPMVGWTLFPADAVAITGTTVDYASSPGAVRRFCGTCGTGLFYLNATVFPGMIDVQAATLDDPAAFPPTAHVQLADAPAWHAGIATLPGFDRYPD